MDSLKDSTDAEDKPSIFSDGGDAAVPTRRHVDPEQLQGFETAKLLLPLGGLGTDRCADCSQTTLAYSGSEYVDHSATVLCCCIAQNALSQTCKSVVLTSLVLNTLHGQKACVFFTCSCMLCCRLAGQPAGWMVDDIVRQEPKAERSLMHRFNIALVAGKTLCSA